MTDCYIYDHVRTPRGRGRPDGALHEVPAIDLAAPKLVPESKESSMGG